VKDILSLVPPISGEPNRLSKDEAPYYALENMHIATRLPDEITSPPVPRLGKERGAKDTLQLSKSDMVDKPLRWVSRTRRSALEFNNEISMSLENFGSLLYYATRGFRADFRNPFSPYQGEGLGVRSFISLY